MLRIFIDEIFKEFFIISILYEYFIEVIHRFRLLCFYQIIIILEWLLFALHFFLSLPSSIEIYFILL